MKRSELVDAYLRGHLSPTEFASADITVENLAQQCAGCDGMAEWCRDILVRAFVHLDSVPRTDPFWQNTNLKPTIYKVQGYAHEELEHDEDSARAAEVLIADALRSGGQHLDIRYWRPVAAAGRLNVLWLTRSAWNGAAYWPDRNLESLASIAKQLGVVPDVLECLAGIGSLDADARQWAEDLRRRLTTG